MYQYVRAHVPLSTNPYIPPDVYISLDIPMHPHTCLHIPTRPDISLQLPDYLSRTCAAEAPTRHCSQQDQHAQPHSHHQSEQPQAGSLLLGLFCEDCIGMVQRLHYSIGMCEVAFFYKGFARACVGLLKSSECVHVSSRLPDHT